MNFIDLASFASRIAHDAVGQKRKYTGEPYWHHTRTVAHMVAKVEGATEEMIAAAFLHDTVEDTRLTNLDITREFGTTVASLVFQLTDQFVDPAHGNRGHRKMMECARLTGINPEAQTIKYADLIDNTSSIVKHDPGFALIYLTEKRRILESMTAGDPALWNQAMNLQENGMRETLRILEERRETTYKVYINGRHSRTVFTEEEAWDHICKHPLGTLHKVCDAVNEIRPEFVPY